MAKKEHPCDRGEPPLDPSSEDCRVCGGSGETPTGATCATCGGSGLASDHIHHPIFDFTTACEVVYGRTA